MKSKLTILYRAVFFALLLGFGAVACAPGGPPLLPTYPESTPGPQPSPTPVGLDPTTILLIALLVMVAFLIGQRSRK